MMLLVVYDLGGGTVSGTYGLSLEVGQDVVATGDASSMGITAGGAPVAGALLTLVPGGAGSGEGAVYFMGGCGASTPGDPVGWVSCLIILVLGLSAAGMSRRRIRKRG